MKKPVEKTSFYSRAFVLILALVFSTPAICVQDLPEVVDSYTFEKKGELMQREKEKISEDILQKTDKLHIPFIENQGQIENSNVKYYADILTGRFFLTSKDLTYSVSVSVNNNTKSKNGNRGEIETYEDDMNGKKLKPNDKFKNINGESQVRMRRRAKEKYQRAIFYNFREIFINQDGNQIEFQNIEGKSPALTSVSDFRGNDPEKWKSDLNAFEQVSLGEIWKGISIDLKARGNNIEKIFTVNAGADPSNILVKIEGAESIFVNQENQELMLRNSAGDISLTKPFAYQYDDNNVRRDIPVRYKIIGSGAYMFEVGEYDVQRPLIIDPLLAATYLGGSGSDGWYAFSALDAQDNVFIVSQTSSLNYPVTAGAYDETYNNGYDAVVSKLDSNYTTLLASTYLGGSSAEMPWGIDIDTNTGNVVITGDTASNNFPITSGVYDTSYNNGGDAFVSILNSSLNQLVASTYLGAASEDEPWGGVLIDSDGEIIVTGTTNSIAFPMTGTPYDNTHNGGYDHFVAKLNGNLTQLLASTYIGGTENDDPWSTTLDSDDNIYILGISFSDNYPTTPGAFQAHKDPTYWERDAVIAKLDNNLTSLLASTYLGGSWYEILWDEPYKGIQVDTDGEIFVLGTTNSPNFPVTSGAYDTTYNVSDNQETFVSKFSNDLTTLIASTFLGGEDDEEGTGGLAINSAGDVYVSGAVPSEDFPVTYDAYDVSNAWECYISKFDNNLSTLKKSTYYSGQGAGSANQTLLLDSNENVIISGMAWDSGLPIPAGSYDQTYNGSDDIHIAKFSPNLNANLSYKVRKSENIDFEGFNEISFPPDDWTTGGNANWSRTEGEKYEGLASATSGTITHNQSTWMQLNYDFPADGYVKFRWKVDSQDWYDRLAFCYDNVSCTVWSGYRYVIYGTVDWEEKIVPVTSGNHILRWLYQKNASISVGSDHGWIDDIRFYSTYDNITAESGVPFEAAISLYEEDTATTRNFDFELPLIIKGANPSGNNQPTCTDKNGNSIAFGNSTALKFTAGIAECTMTLYKAETADINSDDGEYDSYGNPSYTLKALVTGGSNPITCAVDPARTTVSVSPNPAGAGKPVTIIVTTYDSSGAVCSGNAAVTINVTGPETVTISPADNNDGTHTGTFTPGHSGTYTIAATVNGTDVSTDLEVLDDFCLPNYLKLQNTKNDKVRYKVHICTGGEAESEELGSKNDQSTGLKKVYLKAKSTKRLMGTLKFNEVASTVPKTKTKSGKKLKTGKATPTFLVLYPQGGYLTYKTLRVKPGFSEKGLSEAKLYLRVKKNWLVENDIRELAFLRTSNKEIEVLKADKYDTTANFIIYRVKTDKLSKYLTIIGFPRNIVTPVLPKKLESYQPPASPVLPPTVEEDIDNDDNSEKAIDDNLDEIDGYEKFHDPNGSSKAIFAIDANDDQKQDYLIDTNQDGLSDVYWDPTDDIVTPIIIQDIDNDQTDEYLLDTDGSGERDRYFDPDDGRIKLIPKTEEKVSIAKELGIQEKTKTWLTEFLASRPLLTGMAQIVGIVLPILPLLAELNSPGDLLYLARETFTRLFGVLLWRRKKRREWGIVYDVKSGQPLPLAHVDIFNVDGKRMETRITDKLGVYFFLVEKGRYVIESLKTGYTQIKEEKTSKEKTRYHSDYLGGELNIENPDLVDADIPMREQKLSLLKYFLKTNVSYYLFTAVYWLALGFNIIVVSIFPTAVNFFILALYVALFVLLRFSLRKKRWGVVVDTKGKPLPFVTLAVYDQSNNIQVARTVSDMHGRYLFVLPRGDYFINATAVRGTTAMRQSFTHKRIRAVTKKITLQV